MVASGPGLLFKVGLRFLAGPTQHMGVKTQFPRPCCDGLSLSLRLFAQAVIDNQNGRQGAGIPPSPVPEQVHERYRIAAARNGQRRLHAGLETELSEA